MGEVPKPLEKEIGLFLHFGNKTQINMVKYHCTNELKYVTEENERK